MLKEERKFKSSKIRIYWIASRGTEEIDFKSSSLWYVFGIRGSGKSALLEALAEHYLTHGSAILDLFCSRSGENLGWLRSPWVKEACYKPLLLRSPQVTIECPYETLSWKQFSPKIFNEYDIVISSPPLYTNFDEEFKSAGRILDSLFRRYGWRRYITVIVREAANLFYSRFKLRKSQLDSKVEGLYLLREARHHGLSILLDSQRFYSVDIDIRSLTDFLIIKRLGHMNISRDMFWIFKYVNPVWVRSMKPQHFLILGKSGSLGLGAFEMPYWHARPGERLLELLDIKIKYNK